MFAHNALCSCVWQGVVDICRYLFAHQEVFVHQEVVDICTEEITHKCLYAANIASLRANKLWTSYILRFAIEKCYKQIALEIKKLAFIYKANVLSGIAFHCYKKKQSKHEKIKSCT